jgi:hypothetical protein
MILRMVIPCAPLIAMDQDELAAGATLVHGTNDGEQR